VSSILRFANNQPVAHEDRPSPQGQTPPEPKALPKHPVDPGKLELHAAMVLIVDDTPEARRDLEQKTRNLGYRAVSCECALSAMELLEQMRVDVCLVDMNMPGMSGIEFIQAIRVKRKNLPVIVVSGNCDDEQGAQAIHFGADDYLSKPAVECVLKARIESCLRQAESRRMELGKFLPARVAESVLRDEEILRRPKYSDITVMVCDIRGFSKICETRHPGETIQWICEVMNALSDIILESGGTIVDYVGDEIMAMWGSPIESEEHPTKACQCAVQVQHCVRQLSDKWFETLRCHWGVGIGVHSGLAICGNTGSRKRIKFGPLGNTVNLASRVQGTTKYLHSSILITRDTKNRIRSELVGRRICKIRVNNLKEPVELFEIGDFSGADRAFFPIYEEALAEFESSSGEANKLRNALTKTAELLSKKPDDGPCKLLMLRILQASLGDAFDPVWTMPGK
jgi:adenylate cyclase